MRNRRKQILFRALAVSLGVLPFVLAELILYLCGVGDPALRPDPFIGFVDKRPLFVESEDRTQFEIASNRYLCFQPDGFARIKPEDGYRVFCLGGSTVQGRPYSIETSFARWLRLSLECAEPNRDFEVVNCGGISYASYRLTVILDEVLQHQPDLIIVYTGHNEFLEDRTYAHIKQRPSGLNHLLRWATNRRLYNVVASAWFSDPSSDTLADPSSAKDSDQQESKHGSRSVLALEVDARLDNKGGWEQYQRDEIWKRGVAEHFEFNLRAMVAKCRQAGVEIWFVDPVCNLSDCRPFKAQHRDGMTSAEKSDWNRLREEASALFRTEPIRAIKKLEAARSIDDQHAGLAYDLAKSYELVGRFDEAKLSYQKAIDEDICPLRLTTALRQRLHLVAQETATRLINVKGKFEAESPHGIPGGNLLVDHVHPSIVGHQMIDALIMQHCFESGIVPRNDDWASERKSAHQAHLDSLDNKYYIVGQTRLEALRRWSQGQATRSD